MKTELKISRMDIMSNYFRIVINEVSKVENVSKDDAKIMILQLVANKGKDIVINLCGYIIFSKKYCRNVQKMDSTISQEIENRFNNQFDSELYEYQIYATH